MRTLLPEREVCIRTTGSGLDSTTFRFFARTACFAFPFAAVAAAAADCFRFVAAFAPAPLPFVAFGAFLSFASSLHLCSVGLLASASGPLVAAVGSTALCGSDDTLLDSSSVEVTDRSALESEVAEAMLAVLGLAAGEKQLKNDSTLVVSLV